MDLGTRAWIRNTDTVWQPVHITSLKPLKVVPDTDDEDAEEELEIEVSQSDEILLRNETKKAESIVKVNDLINLQHLHEASILHVLNVRYDEGLIYTATGPIIIALNPFKRMSLYTAEILNKYINYGNVKQSQSSSIDVKLAPHVYRIAANAYRSMCQSASGKGNQSVLISGESGAGKTVSTKYVMQYLATAGNNAHTSAETSAKKEVKSKPAGLKLTDVNAATKVAQQILQSNPILEAFGNARTLRNDNSSRFGKFIKMHFNKNGVLQGATIQTYLLEKVRLVHQSTGERNYHVFYQMTAGCTDEESELWQVFPLEGCRYTNQSDCYERADGVDDADDWKAMREAMDVMNFSPEEQNCLFTITSAIMHLSCVEFVPLNKAGNTGEEGSRIGLYEAAAAAASLLEVSSDDMESVLCSRTIEAGRQKHIVPNSKERAEYARDAMAKCIYGRMFEWIVRRINAAITSKITKSTSFIGILDIFGFEVFVTNSFEQLCINFANEALQQQFNQFMFKLEQNIYEREGIDWSFIDFPDNADCIALIERSRTGIIAILDETCIFPKGDDPMFARKLYQKCTDSSCFSASKRQVVDNRFAITHYAGTVIYDTDGFCDKNKDKLHQDVLDLLKVAGLPLIKEIFSEKFLTPAISSRRSSSNRRSSSSTPSPRRGSKYSSIKAASTASQFRNQLNDLMLTINDTAPHYIRCIKPNDENEADFFHRSRVVDQLRYGGVLQAVQVARAGYPSRLKHKTFVSKYKLLAPTLARRSDLKSHCLEILKYTAIAEEDAQIGKTKVFMRKKVFEELEAKRSLKLNQSAILIQSIYRCHVDRVVFVMMVHAATKIAAFVRGIKAKKRVTAMRQQRACIIIQTRYRTHLCRVLFLSKKHKWIIIQSLYRSKVARREARQLRLLRSSYILQKQYRMRVERRKFIKLRSAMTAIACAYRMRAAKELRRKLYKEAKDVGNLQTQLEEMKKKLLMAENKSSEAMGEEVSNLLQRLEDAQNSKTKVEVELAGHMDKNKRLVKEISNLTIELKSARKTIENLNSRIIDGSKNQAKAAETIMELEKKAKLTMESWEHEINQLEERKNMIVENMNSENAKQQDEISRLNALVEKLSAKLHDEKASVKATVTNPPNGKQDSLATVNSAVIEATVQTSEAEVASLRAQLREANTMNQDLKLQLQKQIDYSAMEKRNSSAPNSEKLSLQHNSVPSSIDISKVSLEVDSLRQENNMLKEKLQSYSAINHTSKNPIITENEFDAQPNDSSDFGQVNIVAGEMSPEFESLRQENSMLKEKLLAYSRNNINKKKINAYNQEDHSAQNQELLEQNHKQKEEIQNLTTKIEELTKKYAQDNVVEFEKADDVDQMQALQSENEELQNALDEAKFTIDALEVSINEESFTLKHENNSLEEENDKVKLELESLRLELREYKDKYEGEVHVSIEKHMKVTELLDSQLQKNQELRTLHDTLSSSDLLSKEKVTMLEARLMEEQNQKDLMEEKFMKEVEQMKVECDEYEKKALAQSKKIDMLNLFKKKLSSRIATLVRDNKRMKAVIDAIDE
eukprot:g2656.t1